MLDAWFIIVMLLGALAFGATLLVYWLKQALARQRTEDGLAQNDLRLLEESAQALIDRLRAASEEAVAAMDRRQAALQALLDEVDARLGESPRPDGGREDAADAGTRARRDVCRLAAEGLPRDEIARRSGLTRGEVALILELQAEPVSTRTGRG